jgi:hypothetical protein
MALTKKADYAFKHTAQIDEPAFSTTADLKTALDSQAVELRTYLNDTLTVESEALFATKAELAGVVTGDIPDASLPLAKLDTDVATQAELNTHKTSTDHDGRYYTESEVDTLVSGKVDKSTLTTAGDIFYATSAGAINRKGIGSAYQSLNVNAAGNTPEYQASLQSLMTAAGDIIVASGANSPARLAKGTAGQVLTINSGETAPEWQTPVKIAEGTYTGDGTGNRTITIGITPKFVYISTSNTGEASGFGMSGNYGSIALSAPYSPAVTGDNKFRPEVVSNGFRVSSATGSINSNGVTYRYFAIA